MKSLAIHGNHSRIYYLVSNSRMWYYKDVTFSLVIKSQVRKNQEACRNAIGIIGHEIMKDLGISNCHLFLGGSFFIARI